MKYLILVAITFFLTQPVGAVSSILSKNKYTSLGENVKWMS